MSSNNLTYEERVYNLLSFKDNDEKLDFETEIIHIEIINQILNLMEDKNISKAYLARVLGTSKSYITQLFTGDKILNLKLLAKLQRIFNIKFNISCKDLENEKKDFLFKNFVILEDNVKFDYNNENKVININDYIPLSKYIRV